MNDEETIADDVARKLMSLPSALEEMTMEIMRLDFELQLELHRIRLAAIIGVHKQ